MKLVLLAAFALLTITSLPRPAVALEDTLSVSDSVFYGPNADGPRSPGSFGPRNGGDRVRTRAFALQTTALAEDTRVLKFRHLAVSAK
jgi:hypothetical protein